MVIFLGVLIFGLRPPNLETLGIKPGHVTPPADPLFVRLDTPFPNCDSPATIQGVMGQLMRNQRSRIIGLSNIQETGVDPDGNRGCRALVNFDFGSQSVAYTLTHLARGRSTWQLDVTPL